jgi:hypothetical protein
MDIGQTLEPWLALLAQIIMNAILAGNLDAQEAISLLAQLINANHAQMVWCALKPHYFPLQL